MKTMFSAFRKIAAGVTSVLLFGLCSSVGQTLNNTINLGRNPVGTVTYHGAGPGGEAYEINGGGNDVWDDFDECTFAYHEFAGDFDVKVQVVSLQPAARWSKAGIMVRESLAEDSRMVFMRVTPTNGPTGNGGNGANDVILGYRTGNVNASGDNGGQHEDGIGLSPAYPNAWIRLSRNGSVFTGFSSADGVSWAKVAQQDTSAWSQGGFASKVTLGLAVDRHSGPTLTADAVFTNYNESTPRFCLGAADSLGCPDRITVYFNRAVGTAATNPVNYSVSGGIPVNGLRPGPNPSAVVLLTGTLTEGRVYTVSVDASVTDASGTVIEAGCLIASFTHGKGFEQRRIHVQYNQISDGSTGPILASQAYRMGIPTATLDRPATEDGKAGFFEEGMPDSGTNERYSGRIAGVLAPVADGNYRFACSSDDSSKLYLSTDDQPIHKTQIAYEPAFQLARNYAACDQRTCVGGIPVQNQSAPIALKAGGHYYLELIHAEGGGGNNASVTWDAGTGSAFTNGQPPVDQSRFILSRFARGYIFYNLGAASVLSGPTDLSVRVGATAAFNVALDGTPPYSFSWKTNGVLVAGANSATLSISNVQSVMNNMQVAVCVSNACGGMCSTNAALTVVPNPILLGCSSRGNCRAFYLTFNRPMNLDGAYSVTASNANGTVTALATANVRYGESQNIIIVDVTPNFLPDTTTYCVTIQGAHSQDGLLIDPNPAVCCFVHGQEYPAFRILDRKWDSVFHGNDVDNFMSSAHYLNDPPDHIYSDHTTPAFTAFETPWQILDDNYGDEGTGLWVVPRTGNYNFWCASDDSSKVFMAADAIPAHKVLICYEPNWSGYREWGGQGRSWPPSNTSLWNGFPNGIPLTQGQLVYLQIDHTEGTGGDHWGVTYRVDDFLPPTNGTPSALTVDQFLPRRLGPNGVIFTTLGDVFCNPGPSEQAVYVGQSASFSVAPDGTPPYVIQWQVNGVAIAGANGLSYTTAPASAANDGDTYTAIISNAFSTNRCSAVLHALHNPIALSASTRNDPAHIYVVYNKPVALNAGNYSVDGGSFSLHGAAYGSSSREIVLATDPILADTTHVLKIAGVVDLESPANPIVTDPTNFTVVQAIGRFCTDFSAGLPAGTISSGPTPPGVFGGSLHVNEQGNTGQQNYWTIPLSQPHAFPSFKARWKSLLNGQIGNSGFGTSFNAGQDIGTAFTASEGAGSGLSVTVDTFDNGGGAVGIALRWNGARVSFTPIGGGTMHGPADLMKNAFEPALVEVTPSGLATFNYDTFVTTAQLPNYGGLKANVYVFAGLNTGGSEDFWIDDVCINDYVLGPILVAVTPHAKTVNECSSVTLTSTVTGSPPYYYQWYKNGAPIAGATGSSYATPPLLRADNGSAYKLVVTNLFSSSNDMGVVTVTVLPRLVSAMICPGHVKVVLDTAWDAASANSPGNYSISGGVNVTSATLGSDGKTVFLTTSPLQEGGCYILTLNGASNSCAASSKTIILGPPKASGPQHLVVIEAENFDANNSPQGATSWVFENSLPGFGGLGYMKASPDTGVNASNGPVLMPALYLDYCINFSTAGTYYFWVRGATGDSRGGGNSLHIALDGANPDLSSGNRIGNNINDWSGMCGLPQSWGWVSTAEGSRGRASVNVPSAGLHTFRLWFREDGLRIDQFVLTTDPAFNLGACQAPLAATPPSGPQLRISLESGGQVVLTWDSAGCRLQGASVLGGSPGNWRDLAISSPFTATGSSGIKFYRLIFP